MAYINPNNKYLSYFKNAENISHKQFLALRRFFLDGCTAQEVAVEFGYSKSTVYSMARDFKKKLEDNPDSDPFFITNKPGRKGLDEDDELVKLITALRKKYFSVPEIKSILDAQDIDISERVITTILTKNGFDRLPRRDTETRENRIPGVTQVLTAPKSKKLSFESEVFTSQLAAVLCFLPVIASYGIDKAIMNSRYPGTRSIGKLSSILCFLALKLSSIGRYSEDDTWCMDRGMGLFAGLNVLPKAAWFSSYSSGTTTEMNRELLRSLYQIWQDEGLLSDSMNLDFTTVPYWGDDSAFENNWSGKRGKSLASMFAVLAQDPESGIICHGDTTIRHDRQNEVVLEFLDFYRSEQNSGTPLQYLIFDSKFTTYENLNKLNRNKVKFITIRRRGKSLVDRIDNIPSEQWKKVRIQNADGKGRTLKVYEEKVNIKGYDGEIRQICITGHGKMKPAIIITNEFDLSKEAIVRKYSRRWIVEKGISEQIEFFHLNRNCSGMVIKVDFDLTMSILAHNVYRIFSLQLDGYSHCEDKTIFEKFIYNAGDIVLDDNSSKIEVRLKRKRNLPLLLERMSTLNATGCSWLNNMELSFTASTTT